MHLQPTEKPQDRVAEFGKRQRGKKLEIKFFIIENVTVIFELPSQTAIRMTFCNSISFKISIFTYQYEKNKIIDLFLRIWFVEIINSSKILIFLWSIYLKKLFCNILACTRFWNVLFFYKGICFHFRFLVGRLLYEWKCDLRFLWLACVNKFSGLMAMSGTSCCPWSPSWPLLPFFTTPPKDTRVCEN